MTKPLVSNALWAAVEPLLLPELAKPRGGRPRVDDRTALTGILFVLHSGIARATLPSEIGCSGMTCRRRPRDRQAAGVLTRLHRALLERVADADLPLKFHPVGFRASAVQYSGPARIEPDSNSVWREISGAGQTP